VKGGDAMIALALAIFGAIGSAVTIFLAGYGLGKRDSSNQKDRH